MKEMNRREFLTLTGAAVVALSLAGCVGAPSAPTLPDDIRAQQALDALNKFRRDKGLTELVYEKDLEELTDLLISPFVKEGKPVVDRTEFSSYVDAVQDEHNLRLYDTALDMAAINKALVVQDVAVISSQICNDTLEDYFKQITGGEGIA